MLKVANHKAILRLTVRNLKANRGRNAMASLAIALTCLLFTALLTVGLNTLDIFQQTSIKQSGGEGHVALKYINKEIYDKVKSHPLVKEISFNQMLSEQELANPELAKRRTEFYYMDDVGIRFAFAVPTTGEKPQETNEIIMDTKTLELMNVPLEIGAPVKLDIIVKGVQKTRDFVLSGWWQTDKAMQVGLAITSKAYAEAYKSELEQSYVEGEISAGAANSYIMFSSATNFETKLEKVIADSGYSSQQGDENYIETGINWAYVSGKSADPITVAIVLALILLIVVTGYLIIYNIFQIAVVKDIRFYGLLKTIGTTGKQIKIMLRGQALVLCLAGIPFGLLLGYFIGRLLMPAVIKGSFAANSVYELEAHPAIFIVAALFSILTVLISTAKPAQFAAKISPVEAERHTDAVKNSKRKEKKKTKGGKLHRMAFANVTRAKDRTAITVLSLSLCLVVLTCAVSISESFDMDIYLSKFTDSDFLLAHARYMQYNYHSEEDALSEKMVQAVKTQQGFKEGGYFFYQPGRIALEAPKGVFEDWQLQNNLLQSVQVYGADDFPLSRRTVVEGVMDFEKLATGKYIIEGLYTDDNDDVEEGASHYNIGDTVRLACQTGPQNDLPVYYEYIVLAKVKLDTYTATARYKTGDYAFYLPHIAYAEMINNPAPMSYVFNVADESEELFAAFIKNYTEIEEPLMHYEAKGTHKAAFIQLQSLFSSVGFLLGIIIGLVGIINFINVVITSVIARKQEIATMQSVGLTTKQLYKLLGCEGIYYVLFGNA